MIRKNSYPPTVRVDGDAIRRIREAKALTQLYVAEVVGVTVDTVSRWENNRTQAVRKENASALADALEVSIEDILQREERSAPEVSHARDVGSKSAHRRSLLAAVLAAAAITAALAVWRYASPIPLVVEASRRLPSYAPPGTEVPVVVTIRIISGQAQRVILREVLPPKWLLVGATAPPDQGPTSEGVVKWILPLHENETRLTYVVRTPPDGEEGSAHRFAGEVVTPAKGAKTVRVKGTARIDLEYIHWADEDGDFHISDPEVLDALSRLEGAAELGLEPADLRRLWGAAEYQWDRAQKGFRLVERLRNDEAQ